VVPLKSPLFFGAAAADPAPGCCGPDDGCLPAVGRPVLRASPLLASSGGCLGVACLPVLGVVSRAAGAVGWFAAVKTGLFHGCTSGWTISSCMRV
jgi:hypothetical protein